VTGAAEQEVSAMPSLPQQKPLLSRAIAAATLILLSVTASSGVSAQDEQWWSGFYLGPSFDVRTMTVYDGRLIAGGDFTQIAGEPIPYLAAWDGEKWSALGNGPGGEIRAVTVYQGDLIAAGYINDHGNAFRKFVVRWNGSEWSNIGGAFDASIWCLAVFGDDLIAGGYFHTVEADSCAGVARWDGTAWRSMGGGLADASESSSIWALGVCDGSLYAGGHFTHSGPSAVSGIARWNGESWEPVGAGFDRNVGVLGVYNGELIAGGNFVRSGDITVNCIAAWNGSTWRPLAGGVLGPRDQYGEWPSVGALHVVDEKLYVGGHFQAAGNVTANNIAVWDGSSWNALGAGLQPGDAGWAGAFTLCPYNGSVYVGGRFGLAGGERSRFLARWSPLPYPPGLAFFHAERSDSSVTLAWRPAGSLSETSTFRVFRSAIDRDHTEVMGQPSVVQGNFSLVDGVPLEEATEYWIWSDSPDGVPRWFGPMGVKSVQPPAFRLAYNWPNPFQESTRFSFEITRPSSVSLKIVDVTGREIATPLAATSLVAGPHVIQWDGRDNAGHKVPAGVYFYVFSSPEGRQARKLVVQR
jgi:hypothetical protein